MPRKKPLLSTTVVNDVVEVNSRAYGKHYRKPRGSMTPISINNAFQKSVELNNLANPIAKAIKDALDPFRKEFKDGTMWSRLVGLLKTTLREKSTLDFSILENFDICTKFRMGHYFSFNFTVTTLNDPEPSIYVKVSTKPRAELVEYEVKCYLQTLIVIFLDANNEATTFSKQVSFSLEKKPAQSGDEKKDEQDKVDNQIMQLPVPRGAKWALIVVKCTPSRNGETYALMKLNKMEVLKAYAL